MTTLLPPNVKVHLALGFIDMRKGIRPVTLGRKNHLSAALPKLIALRRISAPQRRNWFRSG
jgi:hypothetical protein